MQEIKNNVAKKTCLLTRFLCKNKIFYVQMLIVLTFYYI